MNLVFGHHAEVDAAARVLLHRCLGDRDRFTANPDGVHAIHHVLDHLHYRAKRRFIGGIHLDAQLCHGTPFYVLAPIVRAEIMHAKPALPNT